MRTAQRDVSRKNSQGWGREWGGRRSFLSLPLPLFLFIFFPALYLRATLHYFKPWERLINGGHDFRDVVIAWRITVLASSQASRLSTVTVQVVYLYFGLRFRVICQNRYKEAVHLKIFHILITAKHCTAGRSSLKNDQKRTCVTSPWLRSNHLIAFFLELQVWKKVTENT